MWSYWLEGQCGKLELVIALRSSSFFLHDQGPLLVTRSAPQTREIFRKRFLCAFPCAAFSGKTEVHRRTTEGSLAS